MTPLRLSEADYALLDAIVAYVGTTSRNEAIRVVLRQFARARSIKAKPAKKK